MTNGGKLSKKKLVVSAPMSFNGSYLRTANALWHGQPSWFQLAFGWWMIVLVLSFWWMAIVTWYVFFGILLVPYRLIRRGGRKRTIEQKRHEELLEALRGGNIPSSASPGRSSTSTQPQQQVNVPVVISWVMIGFGLIAFATWVSNIPQWWGIETGWDLVGRLVAAILWPGLVAGGVVLFLRTKD
jgi:hypothetical protein